MAKRATLVRELRDSGEVLLLDAGGFAAGGVYDTYTGGRASDSVRTAAVIAAMAAMKYDAAAVGDDDLQYGGRWLLDQARRCGLPLVSANCFTDEGRPLAARYVLVRRGGIIIAVTGVTTHERLFPIDETVAVRDPVDALRAIWPEMRQKSQVQVVLSHCGEEVAGRIADAFPACRVLVNGHRKSDVKPMSMRGAVAIMQFGYQGKKLSCGVLGPAPAFQLGQSRWLEVNESVPQDTAVVNALARGPVAPARQVYDLYIMSQCPYGLTALPEFLRFVDRFPGQVEWGVWFVGAPESDGTLRSLHGEQEVADEKVWLAVKAGYPGRWAEFLKRRCESTGSTMALAGELGLDTVRLSAWAGARGSDELRMHYLRSVRLGVDASPTLAINNTVSELAVQRDRLAREQCSRAARRLPACDSLPACIDDADCRQPGKVGACRRDSAGAACVFRDAVAFTFTVVTADTAQSDPEDAAVSTTRELFAGATVRRVSWASAEGRRLIALVKPAALPLYLFDAAVAADPNYEKISSGLVKADKHFTFRPGVLRPTFYHQRPEKRGSVTLFVDPVFDQVGDVLAAVDSAAALSVRPIIAQDPAAPPADPAERLRREEAQRWLLIAERRPASLPAYLRIYRQRPATSYWHTAAERAGVDVDSLTAWAMADSSRLQSLWTELRALDVREPVMVLRDNRRVVPVSNVTTLGKALAPSGRRLTAQ